MSYLTTENVKVFPAARRNIRSSRSFSEQITADIINQLFPEMISGPQKGFTIYKDGYIIYFNLAGRFFKATFTSEDKPLYVGIEIDDTTGEIVGQDVSGEYEGLVYNKNNSFDDNITHTLQLLDESGNLVNQIPLSLDSAELIKNIFNSTNVSTDNNLTIGLDDNKPKISLTVDTIDGGNII